jgi:hypothetical protein
VTPRVPAPVTSFRAVAFIRRKQVMISVRGSGRVRVRVRGRVTVRERSNVNANSPRTGDIVHSSSIQKKKTGP